MTVIGESSVLLQIKSIQLFGIKFSPINLNKKLIYNWLQQNAEEKLVSSVGFIQWRQCFLEKGNPHNAEGVIYSNLTDKIMQDWDEIKWDGDEIKHWLLPFIQLQHSFFPI